MKEIGGYISIDTELKKTYHEGAYELNTGRNCLLHLIHTKKITEIYLPHFICDSVIKTCKKSKCKITYYKITDNFKPILDKKLNKNAYVYLVNYYGTLSNEYIKNFKKQYDNLIVDNVQAFFQKPINSVDTIYSCRKFFPVSDGAYLYTNAAAKDYEIDFSKDRMVHILGRADENASKYYANYLNNEKKIADENIKKMSLLTQRILSLIDYSNVRKIRTRNFKYLNSCLSKTNKIKIKNISGAYIYPYYVENANILRDKLLKANVYVPILWPNVLENQDHDDLAYSMAKNIINLPVDQRYNLQDMKKIIKLLLEEEC